jgi:hypothetical protein
MNARSVDPHLAQRNAFTKKYGEQVVDSQGRRLR